MDSVQGRKGKGAGMEQSREAWGGCSQTDLGHIFPIPQPHFPYMDTLLPSPFWKLD